jgi:quinol monooxygenase YgiN
MSLIVAGTYRVAPEQVEALRPHAKVMMAASQAEDGCLAYAHSQDLADPGLMRFFEIWRDRAALAAHAAAAHMNTWRAAGAKCGVHDRHIVVYNIASESLL